MALGHVRGSKNRAQTIESGPSTEHIDKANTARDPNQTLRFFNSITRQHCCPATAVLCRPAQGVTGCIENHHPANVLQHPCAIEESLAFDISG